MEPIATHFILLVTGFVQIYYYFLDGKKDMGSVSLSVKRNEPLVFCLIFNFNAQIIENIRQ